MSSELTLREIQLSSLSILRTVDEICRELDLDYFVMYGTLLGAIRHQGFIPWDDDVDIMMPRRDYNRLIEHLSKNSEKYLPIKLFNYRQDEGYPYMISRVSDVNYEIHVENENNYGLGTFIDIYPLDSLSKSYPISVIKGRYLGWLSSLYFLSTREQAPRNSSVVKKIAFSLSKLMGKSVIKRLLMVNKDNAIDYESNCYLGCAQWMTNNYKANIFNSELFIGREEVKFEDIKVKIPKEYDAILTQYYGDYMSLPKVEDRQPHHLYTAFRK